MGSCSKDFPLRSSIKAAFGKRSNLVIQARSYLPNKKLSTPIDIQSTLPYPTHLRVTAKECLLTRAKVVPALTSAPLAHPVFQVGRERQRQPEMELFRPRSLTSQSQIELFGDS